MKTTNEMKKYTAADLINSISFDRWSVRDEAMRRHAIAAKKFSKLKEELAQIERVIAMANA